VFFQNFAEQITHKNVITETFFMKPLRLPLFLSTAYLLVYASTPHWAAEYVTVAMYLLSPAVVIALVFYVLIKGKPSHLTSKEAFYEDYPAKNSFKEEG
jgi:hypothetical protein